MRMLGLDGSEFWTAADLADGCGGQGARKGLEGRGRPAGAGAFPQGMERSGTPESPVPRRRRGMRPYGMLYNPSLTAQVRRA
jgi:hypothetical protein